MRKSLILLALAGALLSGPAYAQSRTDVNIAMQLEPPSLDPTTGGAAAAIRSVTYDNIFEGLTRIDKDGAVQPLEGTAYRTGDVALRDEDGWFTYVGRADDVFKASDYRISPFE